jgi:small-conductance mechanosensitive channel
MEKDMSFDWSEIVNVDTLMAWLLTSGVHILLIAVGAFVAVRVLAFASRRIERFFEDDDPDTVSEREKQAATLGKIIRNLIRIAVWGVAGIMILKELGIEIGPILAGVGIAGLAIGFGAQSLVKDFLAGAFVLIENQYNVGDVIRAADVAGLVERVTLRSTTLRDLEGRVHIIPNGSITVVTNMTKLWSRVVLDIGVAYKEDVDHVMELLKEVADEMAADPRYASMITAPVEVLGVEQFADSAVVIRVMFTTQPIKQWAVGREYRRRVKKVFDAKGIEIPFPHQTVYLGEGKPMGGKLKVDLERSSEGSQADRS